MEPWHPDEGAVQYIDRLEAEIKRLQADTQMLQAKAENARAKAIVARDAANLAVEYAVDCLTLAARMQATR